MKHRVTRRDLFGAGIGLAAGTALLPEIANAAPERLPALTMQNDGGYATVPRDGGRTCQRGNEAAR
jgi:hypothetical protein